MSDERPLTPAQEELLIAVLAGERSRDEAEVKAAMADARFAAELAALEGVQQSLDAAGSTHSADLRRSEPALEAIAERSVRAAMGVGTRSGRILTFRRFAAVVAAAIAVAVLWNWRETPQTSPSLGGSMRIEVGDGPVFTFSFALPPGGRYQIEVTTTDGRVESHRVEWPASAWTPDRTTVDGWGQSAEVSAKALDRDGTELASGRGARWTRGR
jgi:hypothetical protein